MPQVSTTITRMKTVASPCLRYDSLAPFYSKARAIIGGQAAVKEYDTQLDVVKFTNLLIPFSVSMTPAQYMFYKSEAELPGFCSQYMRLLVAGLLRKRPDLVLPKSLGKQTEEIYNWIMSDFTSQHGSLVGFLDEALEEEITTSRAWVAVNFPVIPEDVELEPSVKKALRPYPIIIKAESVINWREGVNPVTRLPGLSMLVIRSYVERENPDNEFHPDLIDTVWVHEIDANGYYQVRKYEKAANDSTVMVSAGDYRKDYTSDTNEHFTLIAKETNIMSMGKRLTRIPIFPLNGSIQGEEPILMPLIDRETGLYNKVSRRNHLMYGAATYTPIISSDMQDEEVQKITNAGLGSWLRVRVGEDIKVLETPTDALKDMDRAIEQAVLEIARMGIRMLAPDVRDQSGVALEIRNATQTAQLGTLNSKVSQTMRSIIVTMINWRYGLDIKEEDVIFNLSPDFNPAPLGADWLRLVTEWYDSGKIPRSTWLEIIKANDIIPNDYDDGKAKEEIDNDDLIIGPPKDELDFQVETARRLSNVSDNAQSAEE
jgi:Domain of unknown function (DUF4055)